MGEESLSRADQIALKRAKRARKRGVELRALRALELQSARAFETASIANRGALKPDSIEALRNKPRIGEGITRPVRSAHHVHGPDSYGQLIDVNPIRRPVSSPKDDWLKRGGHDLVTNWRPLLQRTVELGRQNLLFVVTVIVPVLLATVYYCLIASNEYVSEFRFAVRDTATSKASPAGGLLSALGVSSGSNTFDNYLVTDYLSSRQATEELQKRINVIAIYSKPEIDWLSRFDSSKPIERFVAYWQSKVTARFDQITGIATAQVRAYTPEDALLVANSLVALSEELVNRIPHRSQEDQVRFAQREVEQAEVSLRNLSEKLAEYRTRVGVIDPKSSVIASNSSLTQTLQMNLAQLELQEASLLAQKLRPDSPALVALKHQISSTKEQIRNIESSVGKMPGGRTLSTVVGEYEQLDLERQFAQNMVTDARKSLERARASASAQQLYITPYVRPNLPQSATYPSRVFSIFMVALFGLIVWVCSLLVLRSVQERFH